MGHVHAPSLRGASLNLAIPVEALDGDRASLPRHVLAAWQKAGLVARSLPCTTG
jgi:hypothetical protein